MRRETVLLNLFSVCLVLLCSCTRAPLRSRDQAMRPVNWRSVAGASLDDKNLSGLAEALEAIAAVSRAKEKVKFGSAEVSREAYQSFLRRFAEQARRPEGLTQLNQWLEENASLAEVYGGKRWGEVLLTGYYEPEIRGSLSPTEEFTQPIYARPRDLVEVPLSLYDERFFDVGTMRGRLENALSNGGKLRLLPYFTRGEIDGDGKLKRIGLELAYADPVDVFFLHIQGAGRVRLADGSLIALGYADQNGHAYEAIGKFLPAEYRRDELTQAKLETYVRSLSPAERSRLFNRNPSYVFYEKRGGAAKTSFGVDVFPGRTLATDARFFPKGAVALLQYTHPSTGERAWRIVVDTDTGGAIRGGGRADLFFGSGDVAKQEAGEMRHPARLIYLVPKESPAVTAPTTEPVPPQPN